MTVSAATTTIATTNNKDNNKSSCPIEQDYLFFLETLCFEKHILNLINMAYRHDKYLDKYF